ncbi:MAG: uncharacterized membrane-anchored protein YjiN (DUF445 family) [Candidatus Azotimanducaceae bacterium]|jgi:uncharacterized membrane-anchored protein YjiN (DUF445 family)
MFLENFTELELEKQAELQKMKHLASGLFLFVTVVYIIASIFSSQHEVIPYIQATAEASMIGALADWFAVTALFRYPLGIKIPHTAIIPNRKNSIADQFGVFVQQNFLSEEVITDKIRSIDLSRRVAHWLIKPENSHAVAEQITDGIAGVVKVMNDKDIQAMIERKLEGKIRDTSFAPLIGDVLTFLTSGKRQQAAFDAGVKIALNILEDSDDQLREKIQQETPWWFPGSLDKAVYRKIMRSTSKALYEMQVDIYHPMRVRLVQMSNEFMEDLKHSEEIKEKEISIKEDILKQVAVRDFTGSLWNDIKTALLEQSESPDAELKTAIQGAVERFGQTILEDHHLAGKVNGWAEDGSRYLINNYGHEVANLITQTIEAWDPKSTSERIEIQIGKDLQFIRINGTVVGGLAGLSIHSVSELVSHFYS